MYVGEAQSKRSRKQKPTKTQTPQNMREKEEKTGTLGAIDDGIFYCSSWNSSIFRTLQWPCRGPSWNHQNAGMRIRGWTRAQTRLSDGTNRPTAASGPHPGRYRPNHAATPGDAHLIRRNGPGCTYISTGCENKRTNASTNCARRTKNGRFAVSRTRENTLVAPKNDDNGRRSWRKRATSFSQTIRSRYRTDSVIGAVPRPGARAEKNENWRFFRPSACEKCLKNLRFVKSGNIDFRWISPILSLYENSDSKGQGGF